MRPSDLALLRGRADDSPTADTGGGVPARTRSAARSPMIMAAVFVLAETIDGITDASATRSPRTPRTRSDGSTTASGPTPMRHVPTGW